MSKRTRFGGKSKAKSKKAEATNGEALKDPYHHLYTSFPCSRDNHVRKKNCSSNLRCVYGLGEHKEGIWSKNDTQHFLQKYAGRDLRKDLRPAYFCPVEKKKVYVPVGLKNLGATCYLNAMIQCLYHNVLLRNAILNIETGEPLVDVDVNALSYQDRSCAVIDSLQLCFTYLKHNRERSYSLGGFTSLLGLDTGEQQDLREFCNLLMAKIDSSNFSSQNNDISPLYDLINGEIRFTVTCSKCSHKSSRSESFCELDLAIEQHESVNSSLDEYFGEEILNGDNKYECPCCCSREIAVRRAEISKAPPVMFLQLRRNVFDLKTFQKTKLKNSISFPSSISILDNDYKLTTVLYHRGESGYGGHYVAEVLNWDDDNWWLFDDASVIYSPEGPCGTRTKLRTTTSAESKEPSCQHLTGSVSCGVDMDDVDAVEYCLGGKDIENYEKLHRLNRKKDVYMLVYVKDDYFSSYYKKNGLCTPNSLWRSSHLTMATEKNLVVAAEFRQYIAKEEWILREIDKRKAQYDEFNKICSDNTHQNGTISHLVPTSWLRKWVCGINDETYNKEVPKGEVLDISDDEPIEKLSSGIDDGFSKPERAILFEDPMLLLPYACSHSTATSSVSNGECFIHPKDLINNFKLVPQAAFEILTCCVADKNNAVDYDFTTVNVSCSLCSVEEMSKNDSLVHLSQKYSSLLDMINFGKTESVEHDRRGKEGHYVIEKRFVSWLKKQVDAMGKICKNNHSKGKPSIAATKNQLPDDSVKLSDYMVGGCEYQEDRVPNSSLLCRHRRLVPNYYKRIRVISQSTWKEVSDLFPDAVTLFALSSENSKSTGFKRKHNTSNSLLPAGLLECDECIKETKLLQEELKNDKSTRRDERTGNNKCLNDLARRKGLFPQRLTSSKKYYVVDSFWLHQWRNFTLDVRGEVSRPALLTNDLLRCPHGGVIFHLSIRKALQNAGSDDVESASVGMANDEMESNNSNLCELITEEQWLALERLGYFSSNATTVVYCSASISDDGTATWQSFPQECAICASQNEDNHKISRTYFSNKPIQVHEVHSLEELDRLVNKALKSPCVESKRPTRQTRQRASKDILVSSDDILALLKLKIYQVWPHAPPFKQNIFDEEGKKLEGYTSSLESLKVLAGSILYIMVADEAKEYNSAESSSKRKLSLRNESQKSRKVSEAFQNDNGCDEMSYGDGGESEMWQIVSLHASNTLNDPSSVTDLTGSDHNQNAPTRSFPSEQGFSGTFLRACE